LSNVCWGENTRTHLLQSEVLIIKFLPIDGLATNIIMACEVTILVHKTWNNCEKVHLITKCFLCRVLSMKDFCFLCKFVSKKLEGLTNKWWETMVKLTMVSDWWLLRTRMSAMESFNGLLSVGCYHQQL
jgi:hypothetical protein